MGIKLIHYNSFEAFIASFQSLSHIHQSFITVQVACEPKNHPYKLFSYYSSNCMHVNDTS